MKKQKGAVNITLKIILFIVLAAYSVSLLFPLAWGLLTSFKSSLDFDTLRNVLGLPDMEFSRDEVLKFSNYTSMFKDIRLARSVSFFMGNTEITHNSINGLGGMIINSLVYALGGAGMLLPRHNSAYLGPAAQRAAAGALERLPIARVDNLAHALDSAEEKE